MKCFPVMALTLLLLQQSVMAEAPAENPAPDPLPSWRDGQAKRTIVEFVERVTRRGGEDFVPAAERIAVFDNDGTLWCEQPIYVQLAFAVDRVRKLAPNHPEWKTQQPFKAAIDGDMKTLAATGKPGLMEILKVSHAGNTTEEFEQIVRDWISTARHPQTGRLYTEMIYQPMRELLTYLRAHGFQTWIVSGGGVEFMRPWVGQTYGIPPEQVIGSTIRTKFEIRDGRPVIVRLPEVDFINDGEGKPININRCIGRRPIAAFGNSDGDFQMLQWTTAGKGARLGMLVHHDDAEREFAYDRRSSIGRLDRGLDEAARQGWTVLSMQRDWAKVFPAK